MQAVFATVMTTLTFAVIPWAIAQLAIRWQPKLQHQPHRRNFRWITAGIAVVLTIPSMFQAIGPWFYLLAIAGAVALDVRWFKYAKTNNGARHLADAKTRREMSTT